MADSINLNATSPGVFNQATVAPQQTLTPAVSNPSVAASSAPPTAAPNVSTPISQTAGGGAAATQGAGLGGGVAVPTPVLGGGVSNPSPVLGDALSLGGFIVVGGSSSGGGQIPEYATPGALPAITSANADTQAIVVDIGNGSRGLYIASGGNWCFLGVIAP